MTIMEEGELEENNERKWDNIIQSASLLIICMEWNLTQKLQATDAKSLQERLSDIIQQHFINVCWSAVTVSECRSYLSKQSITLRTSTTKQLANGDLFRASSILFLDYIACQVTLVKWPWYAILVQYFHLLSTTCHNSLLLCLIPLTKPIAMTQCSANTIWRLLKCIILLSTRNGCKVWFFFARKLKLDRLFISPLSLLGRCRKGDRYTRGRHFMENYQHWWR